MKYFAVLYLILFGIYSANAKTNDTSLCEKQVLNPTKLRYQHLIYNGFPGGTFIGISSRKYLRFMSSGVFEIGDSSHCCIQSFYCHQSNPNESLRQIVVDQCASPNLSNEVFFPKGSLLTLSATLDSIICASDTFVLDNQEGIRANPESFYSVWGLLPYLYKFEDNTRQLWIDFEQVDILNVARPSPYKSSRFCDKYHVHMPNSRLIVIDSLVSSTRSDYSRPGSFVMPYRNGGTLASTHSAFPILQHGDTIYVSPDQKRLWVSHVTFDAPATSECSFVKSKYDWDAINHHSKKTNHGN